MCQTVLGHQIVVVKGHVMTVVKHLYVNVTQVTWVGNVSMNVYMEHRKKTTHVYAILATRVQLVR